MPKEGFAACTCGITEGYFNELNVDRDVSNYSCSISFIVITMMNCSCRNSVSDILGV